MTTTPTTSTLPPSLYRRGTCSSCGQPTSHGYHTLCGACAAFGHSERVKRPTAPDRRAQTVAAADALLREDPAAAARLAYRGESSGACVACGRPFDGDRPRSLDDRRCQACALHAAAAGGQA